MFQSLRFSLASFFALNLCKASEEKPASFLAADADAKTFEVQLDYTDMGDYTMAVKFANQDQKNPDYTFTIDTTINTILTTTTECAACQQKNFNMADSTTLVKVTSEPITMGLPGKYPSVTGLQVKDKVCVVSS